MDVEYLSERIKNFYNQIQNNILLIKELPENQRVQWAQEQQTKLLEFKNEIKLVLQQSEGISNHAKLMLNEAENKLLKAKLQLNQTVNETLQNYKQQNKPPLKRLLKAHASQSVANIEQEESWDPSSIQNTNNNEHCNNLQFKQKLQEKESKMDLNFKNLMDRYSRSKALIENIKTSAQSQQVCQNQNLNQNDSTNINEQTTQQAQIKSRPLYYNTDHKLRSSQSVSNFGGTLQPPPHSLPHPPRVQMKLQQQAFQQSQQQMYQSEKKLDNFEKEIILLKRNIFDKIKSSEDEHQSPTKQYSIMQPNLSQMNINESLQLMGQTQNSTSNLQSVSYKQQVTIEELRLKVKSLERQQNEMNQLLLEDENKIQMKQREVQELKISLVQKEDELRGAKGRADQQSKAEGQMLSQIEQYKQNQSAMERKFEREQDRLKKENQQMSEQLSNVQREKARLTENVNESVLENQRLRLEMETEQNRCRLAYEELQQSQGIREQLELALKEQEQRHYEEIRKFEGEASKHLKASSKCQNAILKGEELKEAIKGLEAKLAKRKLKYNKEANAVKEQHNIVLNEWKIKVKDCKGQIKEAQESLLKVRAEYFLLKPLQERSVETIKDLEGRLGQAEGALRAEQEKHSETMSRFMNAMQEGEEMGQQNSMLGSNVQELQDQIDKLLKAKRKDEKRILVLEKEEQNWSLKYEDTKNQLARSDEEKVKMNETNNEMERELEKTKYRQTSEYEEIRRNFTNLLNEVEGLKMENENLKGVMHDCKKDVKKEAEIAQQFKEKYLKVKFENQNLTKNLNQVSSQLKDFMTEKQNEVNVLVNEREGKQKAIKNKLMVLDNIQGLISNHRIKAKAGNQSMNSMNSTMKLQ